MRESIIEASKEPLENSVKELDWYCGRIMNDVLVEFA